MSRREKRKDEKKTTSIIKQSLIGGFSGALILPILFNSILQTIPETKTFMTGIGIYLLGNLFFGNILPAFLWIAMFFCVSYSITYLYFYIRSKNGKKPASFFIALILLAVSIVIAIFFMYQGYDNHEAGTQLELGTDLTWHPEKAEEVFDKAVIEKDYATMETVIITTFETSPEFMTKIYDYVKEHKEELSSTRSRDYSEENYYDILLNQLTCNDNTPEQVLQKIYDEDRGYDFCLAGNPNTPTEILIKIVQESADDPEAKTYDLSTYNQAKTNLMNRGIAVDNY